MLLVVMPDAIVTVHGVRAGSVAPCAVNVIVDAAVPVPLTLVVKLVVPQPLVVGEEKVL